MCDTRPTNAGTADPEKHAREAATSLARLMEQQLGYNDGRIDPIALRLFLRAYWSRVSALAQVVHDPR